jgi:hypothetical protein
MPVTLPPGRDRLVTSPASMRSLPPIMCTSGMVLVAILAARVAEIGLMTRISTGSWTSSATVAASCSALPSVQHASTMRFRPST